MVSGKSEANVEMPLYSVPLLYFVLQYEFAQVSPWSGFCRRKRSCSECSVLLLNRHRGTQIAAWGGGKGGDTQSDFITSTLTEKIMSKALSKQRKWSVFRQQRRPKKLPGEDWRELSKKLSLADHKSYPEDSSNTTLPPALLFPVYFLPVSIK